MCIGLDILQVNGNRTRSFRRYFGPPAVNVNLELPLQLITGPQFSQEVHVRRPFWFQVAQLLANCVPIRQRAKQGGEKKKERNDGCRTKAYHP